MLEKARRANNNLLYFASQAYQKQKQCEVTKRMPCNLSGSKGSPFR